MEQGQKQEREQEQKQEQTQRQEIHLEGIWEAALPIEGETKEATYTVKLPGTLDEYGIGIPVRKKDTMHLSRKVEWNGSVIFRRNVTIPESWNENNIFLMIERARYTQVFVDKKYAGDNNSLVCKQVFDLSEYLTPGEHLLEIRSDNDANVMAWDAIRFSHMASEDTQSNWNGLLGEIKLCAKPKVYIGHVRLTSLPEQISVRVEVCNTAREEIPFSFTVRLRDQRWQFEGIALPGNTQMEYQLSLQDPLEEWSEYHPALYPVKMVLETVYGKDKRIEKTGCRRFQTEGRQFVINGYKTFLRGTHDGCVFPLTGYAPMDMESWIKVFEKAKEYGLNHYRFHSWCPPEAAFAAADQCGMYLQPELPYWSGNAFEDEAEWNYFKRETLHILDEYGNHPSFVMFAWGNELRGSETRMEELIDICRTYDDRHLYTIGSNNFLADPHKPANSDYWTTFWTSGHWNSSYPEIGGAHVRGATPHHTRGHINNLPPFAGKNYDKETESVDIPVVSHEIGQYQVFPDFREIEKYTGVMEAENLKVFRAKMEKKGMLALNEEFAYASGMLAGLCYREEIEAALRTKEFGGFQLLDLKDYPGQGTALVGMLDAFMEEKSCADSKQWTKFCGPTVLLLEFSRYIWRNGETILLSPVGVHYGETAMEGEICIALEDANENCNGNCNGNQISKVSCGKTILQPGGPNRLAPVEIALPKSDHAAQYELVIWMENQGIENRYSIWSYPDRKEVSIPENVYVAREWNEYTVAAAKSGKRILWLMNPAQVKNAICGAFIPDFWCYPMFKKYNPPGTLGISCDKNHPALSEFPTQRYAQWQWWNSMKSGISIVLDEDKVSPIVRTIDNVSRQLDLALIAEGKYAGTPVILCGINFLSQLDRPEMAALYQSLLDYLGGDACEPQKSFDDSYIEELLHRQPEDYVQANADADKFG